MPIKPVLRMGDPLLFEVATPIDQFDTPELHTLIEDMQDTMAHMHGAGIAAPQIGLSKRVVIFGVGYNPRYPYAEKVPYTVLINPVLKQIGDETDDAWEGCLSVPGMRGLVSRYSRLHYTGFDQYGNAIDRLVSGFHARVVQHECDHLDGILYPMRINDLRNFGYSEVLFPDLEVADD
jgi:peptide deformylase